MNEEEQIAAVKQTFDSVGEGYDGAALRFFVDSAEHLASRLDLRGDETVLDVASGTGNAALAIAGRLPRGRVTGVDFSAGMLERARHKASSLNLQNIDFLERDMRDLGFAAGRFDAVVCSFGIFFVLDMDAQLAHIVGALKPGGQGAITSFGEDQFHPLRALMLDRLADYGVAQPPQAWKRVATEAGCRELFERANLLDIRVEVRNVGYHLETAEDWWDVIWNAGFRRLVAQLEPDNLERFKTEHLREVDALRTKDGIWLNAPILFTTGTKP